MGCSSGQHGLPFLLNAFNFFARAFNYDCCRETEVALALLNLAVWQNQFWLDD
jgi:hypothetical protein